MKNTALRLLAIATLVLLSADAFADGRRGRGGRSSGGARYSHRPYVSAYVPIYQPDYRRGYYDDYGYDNRYDNRYDDRYYDSFVSYERYPRYRSYASYRPYPVYRYRPSLVITARFGGRGRR